MVGLGIALLIIGVLLWLTVLPALGWVLMVIGAILVVAALVLGMGMGFARGSRRGGAYW
jgi:hypothetical protein